MAKSVPKKLVIRPKILVTRFFWHRLSRLSKFYFPARREVATRCRDSTITYSLTPNPLQPPASMDKLFDTPSGPISHREVQAAVAEEISLVMYDPVVNAFRSLRQMSANEIAHFNPFCPSPLGGPIVDPDGFDYSSDDSLLDREKLRLRASPKYYYTIGDYESLSFYCEFLSDEAVRTPSGHMVSVREITEEMSCNPKSSFRSWFCVPHYKVTDIVSRFLAERWIGLSHHCRSSDRLQIKTELLVLGSLAMLGGMLQSFRQLKPLRHICASDHSNFFLTFVEHIVSISHEYVFMPRTLEELEPIMQRYEEEGLPGVAGSVNVVHVKRANALRVRIHIRHLLLSALLTTIAAFSECLVLSSGAITISISLRSTIMHVS